MKYRLLFLLSLMMMSGNAIMLFSQHVGVGTDNPLEFFSVGASSQFRVNSQGNLVMINSVSYNFPSSNSSGTLVNNGSGTLSWTNAPALAVTNFTGTLPALNASNLTNLNAANLSGTLPAISGTNLTNLNASNLSSGTVPTARLGTGTANSTTFLRGDGSWQTPAGGGGGGTTLVDSSAFNVSNVTSLTNLGSSITISEAGTYLVQVQFSLSVNSAISVILNNGSTDLTGMGIAANSVTLLRAATFVVTYSSAGIIQIKGASTLTTTFSGVTKVFKLF